MTDKPAVPPSSLRSTLKRMALTVVIAVALGPLVAGLTFFLYSLGILIFDRSGWPPTFTETFYTLVWFFCTAIAVSYFKGSVVALLAGVLVALWMLWRPPHLTVIIAAAVIATLVTFAVNDPDAFMLSDSVGPRNLLLMTMALAVASAAICWFLMRGHVRPHEAL